jgi:hypothetical protein|tara:strand:- start:3323 stop:3634 length:312 start_codon:yes stop_codon:yes gene_type:complete
MTVYVTQKPDGKKNILSASKFGEFEFILKDNPDMLFSPVPTVAKIRKKLQNFSNDDYLLLLGDPAVIGLCVHYALLNNGGKANLLKWDNREYNYFNIEVNTNV